MKDSIKHIVSSEQMIEQCVRDMKQMLSDHGYFNIEIKRGNRSLSQNALYWEWMTEGSAFMNEKYAGKSWYDEDLGETITWEDISKDDLHDQMRLKYLGSDPARRVGKSLVPAQIKSTKKLTKGEMFSYMEKIEMLFAQMGCYLSKPEDSAYAKYQEMQRGG